MISASDVEFHTPPNDSPEWTETNFFSFHVPERNLTGSIYVLTRPNVGVALADVTLFDRISLDRQDCLFIDGRQHLRVPDKLGSYEFPSGIQVKSLRAPRDYSFGYTAADGSLSFDLTFEGLMDPFDPNDPANLPSNRQQSADRHDAEVIQYKGHFDMTGRVRGTLKLRDEELRVDCVETMDHSWGLRREHGFDGGQTMINWIHAHLGEDAYHAIFSFNPLAEQEEEYRFVSGYALREGVVQPIDEAQLTAHRMNGLAVTFEWSGQDRSGHRFALQGGAIAATNAFWYTCADVHYGTYRWIADDGRSGYGINQESRIMTKLCSLARGR